MQKNVSEVLGNLLTTIRGAQREVSVLRDELQQDEALLQLLSLNDKLLKIEASIISELPKTQEIIDKLLGQKKRPGRPKAKASVPAAKAAKKETQPASAPKKRGRKPKAVVAKTEKTVKKPGRRGRSSSKNYIENWIVGYSILKVLSMFNGSQTPRSTIYAIDKVLQPVLTADDKKESKAAKQRGYEGVWATHLSDSIHRERRTLLETGLIEKKVPTGIWKISAKGKQALKTPQKFSEVYASFEISKLPPIAKMYVEDEDKIRKAINEFQEKAMSTRGTKAKAKTTKSKAKTGKKPGRPKVSKVAKTTSTSSGTAKKKPGRPKGAKNKVKKAKVDEPKTPAKKPSALPTIKRPATAKKMTTKKANAKPLHKDLAKRKPGRPPKSAGKSKKSELASEIEKRMAEKEKQQTPPSKPAQETSKQ